MQEIVEEALDGDNSILSPCKNDLNDRQKYNRGKAELRSTF